VKKTSLNFGCLKTIDGLGTAGDNMTWPAWAVVQSQRCCMVINRIELCRIATTNKYFNMGCVTFRSACTISNGGCMFNWTLWMLSLTFTAHHCWYQVDK
jgi:hypothetical protein